MTWHVIDGHEDHEALSLYNAPFTIERTKQMTTFDTALQAYLAIWNEGDDDARTRMAQELFTADAAYVDPVVAAVGAENIAQTVAAVRGQFPGWTFRQLGETDAHNTYARFRWALGPDATSTPEDAPIIGFDVASFTEDGRIEHVTGFLDRVPIG